MDAKNAFLHGDLKEIVYMKPSSRYACLKGYVCKLQKPLYWLKQAPQPWFDKFRNDILRANFIKAGMIILFLFVKLFVAA